jgi:ATP-dependent Clp protease ATP-binding subunit ClpA
MARVIQEHIKKPLADEILFGRLAQGGRVTVDLDPKTSGLCFRFPDRELPAPKADEDNNPEKEPAEV